MEEDEGIGSRLLRAYDSDPVLFNIGGIAVAVVIVIWAISALISGVKSNDVSKKAAEVTKVVKAAQGRVDGAVEMQAKRRGDYPSKYSTQFDAPLQQARERLGAGGQADQLLKDLAAARQKKDWKTSYDLLGKLGVIVSEDVSVVDRILGPPGTSGQGFYEQLDAQVKEVDGGLVDKVQVWVSQVKGYLDLLPRKNLCGSTRQLSYSTAYGLNAQAQAQLEQARRVGQQLIEGMVDKPEVYVQAVAARTMADQAKAKGDGDSSAADQAVVQIQNAQGQIDSATFYVAGQSYNTSQAISALVTARSQLEQAKQACYSENFEAVTANVNAAVASAQNARWLATPPTETPVPPPTVVYDNSSGGGGGSGGDDGGGGGSWWDDGGGSSDDGGSWTNDGGSSDDGGSWSDGGGDDGGSWSDGGDDGGSWSDGGGDDGGSWSDSDYKLPWRDMSWDLWRSGSWS